MQTRSISTTLRPSQPGLKPTSSSTAFPSSSAPRSCLQRPHSTRYHSQLAVQCFTVAHDDFSISCDRLALKLSRTLSRFLAPPRMLITKAIRCLSSIKPRSRLPSAQRLQQTRPPMSLPWPARLCRCGYRAGRSVMPATSAVSWIFLLHYWELSSSHQIQTTTSERVRYFASLC